MLLFHLFVNTLNTYSTYTHENSLSGESERFLLEDGLGIELGVEP